MNILSKTLTILFFILISQVEGIVTIQNISEAKPLLDIADENTLVVFDIDRTLIQMGDQTLLGGKKAFKAELKKYPAYNALSTKEKEDLLSIMLLKTSHDIIEKESLDLILKLQTRHVKTIACTTLETGPYGVFPSIEKWRLDTVNAASLDFSAAFPEHLEIRFLSENSPYPPVFLQGILITGRKSKGEMLKEFLEKIEWQPQKIIMIDDQLSYLKSASDIFKNSSVEFRGLHYTHVEDALQHQERNEALKNLQITHLLKNKIWLTDQEAIPLVSQNCDFGARQNAAD